MSLPSLPPRPGRAARRPLPLRCRRRSLSGPKPIRLPGGVGSSQTWKPRGCIRHFDTDPLGELPGGEASSPLPVRAETDTPAPGVSPVRPAQAANFVGRSNMSANDVISDRGYWQGLPNNETVDAGQTTVARSASAARRATGEKVATANVAPWPMADRGNERAPGVGALSYAAQPASTVARMLPSSASTLGSRQ